jgi:hypothetical protein
MEERGIYFLGLILDKPGRETHPPNPSTNLVSLRRGEKNE